MKETANRLLPLINDFMMSKILEFLHLNTGSFPFFHKVDLYSHIFTENNRHLCKLNLEEKGKLNIRTCRKKYYDEKALEIILCLGKLNISKKREYFKEYLYLIDESDIPKEIVDSISSFELLLSKFNHYPSKIGRKVLRTLELKNISSSSILKGAEGELQKYKIRVHFGSITAYYEELPISFRKLLYCEIEANELIKRIEFCRLLLC